MRKEFKHNGETVLFQHIDEDTFANVLKSKNVEAIELPDKDLSYTVYRYSVNESKKYACTIREVDGMSEKVFITNFIPEDGWHALMLDVIGQVRGEEPRKMETRESIAYRQAKKIATDAINEKYPNNAMEWTLMGYPEEIQNEFNMILETHMWKYGYTKFRSK